MKSGKSKSKFYRRCSYCKKRRKALTKDGVKWRWTDEGGMCPFCVINKFVAFL